ncbi:interleukin-11 [Pelobates fuscus]|uniref:interleukin-11 n=1 Tax=Pelobates fuscus TaxID=191477 RepID=UPI002FE48F72
MADSVSPCLRVVCSVLSTAILGFSELPELRSSEESVVWMSVHSSVVGQVVALCAPPMPEVGSLCHFALTILSLNEGLWAFPLSKTKPSDPKVEYENILTIAKHLLSDTKHVYHNFKAKYPSEGEHKLDTLPTLSINAGELSSIQVPSGLTKLSTDLFLYQKHFDWLKKAAHAIRSMDHEFTSIHNRIDKLVKKIDLLMIKLNIVRVSDPPLPQLPNSTTQWGVVQAGHAIFHHFHLFLDYATRVLFLMKNKL